jgi:hypothetical protein
MEIKLSFADQCSVKERMASRNDLLSFKIFDTGKYGGEVSFLKYPAIQRTMLESHAQKGKIFSFFSLYAM